MKWLEEEMQADVADEKVIWKATNMHHPMWGMGGPLDRDYTTIIDDFLPKLVNNSFDVYFNGHYHDMSIAFHALANKTHTKNIKADSPFGCHPNAEWFP